MRSPRCSRSRKRIAGVLLAAFDYLAEDPVQAADGMAFDWDGFPVHALRYGRFTIGYVIDPDSGAATITLIRPHRR